MIIMLLGSLVALFAVYEVTDIQDKPRDVVYFEQSGNAYIPSFQDKTNVQPLSSMRFKNMVRQAYDYSCGSAALTTVLDYYLGRNFQERHVMEGLLEYGETEKIVERKGFSLLDMKRLVTALGHPAGGFKASIDDIVELEHPAIVPIEYAGFKHFVVIRDVVDSRVFIADPSLGNLSFTLKRFEEVWDRNVVFIVFPGEYEPIDALEIKDEDLRYIDESTINHIAFHQEPQFSTAVEHGASTAMGQVQTYSVLVTDATGQSTILFDLDPDLSADEVEEINNLIPDAENLTRDYQRNPEGKSRLHFKRQ
ncbi:C39 family peptidase [Litoribacillus peritrichatus]